MSLSREPRSTHAGEELSALIASVRDYAIFMLDPQGRVLSWNTGAHLLKGYAASEIVGQSFKLFYPPEEIEAGTPDRLLREAARTGRAENEGWRIRKDGSRFWADVVITSLRDEDGEVRGFLKVTRDLTDRRRIEEERERSERSLAATLYSIGDGVVATDVEGRVTRLNPVAARLTGWSEEEARGRPVHEVFVIVNEESRRPVVNPIDRVLREGIVVGLANHTALIARDGTERPIADSGAPIHGSNGHLHGAVLVFRDVSEERALERALRQSEERLRLMVDSVRDYAIFMLDPAGHITTWNQGAQAIKGYTAAEIIGKHFSMFYRPEEKETKPPHELRVAAAEGRFDDEGWRVRKDGSLFWASVVISAVRDPAGVLVGFTKVTRDLTDLKRAEAERVRLALAREAIQLRDEFISVAAHELRTPLTALQLKLQALAAAIARHGGDPTRLATLAPRLDAAVRQTGRLGDLVERLLDVSRIAGGKLEMKKEEVDLTAVVCDVVEDFREPATAEGCELRLSAPAAVTGTWDRMRIQQVVVNLVSNAIKYGGGRPVDVTVGMADGKAILEVADRGIGISTHNLDRIFGRFERAAPIENYGGLGLGLYITRYIVESHGGEVKVASRPGQGSTFRVELPR